MRVNDLDEGWFCPICKLVCAPWMFVCPSSPHMTVTYGSGTLIFFEVNKDLTIIEKIREMERNEKKCLT